MELIAYSIKGKSWVSNRIPLNKKDITAVNKVVPVKKLLCEEYPSQEVTLFYREKVSPEEFKRLCTELEISVEQLPKINL
jgi:DNA-directed RNA polymerase subunit H (RpoH/RPB5)